MPSVIALSKGVLLSAHISIVRQIISLLLLNNLDTTNYRLGALLFSVFCILYPGLVIIIFNVYFILAFICMYALSVTERTFVIKESKNKMDSMLAKWKYQLC